MIILNSPFYSDKVNLEICIGEVQFRDAVIKNLREQIKNLKESLSNYEEIEVIEANQYKHIRNTDTYTEN